MQRLFSIRPLIIAIVVAIIAVAVFLVFRGGPEFLLTELGSEEIFAGEKTTLGVRVVNVGEEYYENVNIQLATKSSHLTFFYNPETPFGSVNDEYQLTLQVRSLKPGEETGKYVFDVSGKLPPGTKSMEVEVAVRLLANGEKVDERIYILKIKSRGE